MTGSDLIKTIRNRIADTDEINLTDDAILENINTAIRYLSLALIKKKNPIMSAEIVVVDYKQLPEGFHSFIGNPPVFIEGDVLRSYYPNDRVTARYWRVKPPLLKLTDEVAFYDDFADAIVTGAAMLCLNKDEFNTDFEKSLLNSMLNGFAGEDNAESS